MNIISNQLISTESTNQLSTVIMIVPHEDRHMKMKYYMAQIWDLRAPAYTPTCNGPDLSTISKKILLSHPDISFEIINLTPRDIIHLVFLDPKRQEPSEIIPAFRQGNIWEIKHTVTRCNAQVHTITKHEHRFMLEAPPSDEKSSQKYKTVFILSQSESEAPNIIIAQEINLYFLEHSIKTGIIAIPDPYISSCNPVSIHTAVQRLHPESTASASNPAPKPKPKAKPTVIKVQKPQPQPIVFAPRAAPQPQPQPQPTVPAPRAVTGLDMLLAAINLPNIDSEYTSLDEDSDQTSDGQEKPFITRPKVTQMVQRRKVGRPRSFTKRKALDSEERHSGLISPEYRKTYLPKSPSKDSSTMSDTSDDPKNPIHEEKRPSPLRKRNLDLVLAASPPHSKKGKIDKFSRSDGKAVASPSSVPDMPEELAVNPLVALGAEPGNWSYASTMYADKDVMDFLKKCTRKLKRDGYTQRKSTYTEFVLKAMTDGVMPGAKEKIEIRKIAGRGEGGFAKGVGFKKGDPVTAYFGEYKFCETLDKANDSGCRWGLGDTRNAQYSRLVVDAFKFRNEASKINHADTRALIPGKAITVANLIEQEVIVFKDGIYWKVPLLIASRNINPGEELFCNYFNNDNMLNSNYDWGPIQPEPDDCVFLAVGEKNYSPEVTVAARAIKTLDDLSDVWNEKTRLPDARPICEHLISISNGFGTDPFACQIKMVHEDVRGFVVKARYPIDPSSEKNNKVLGYFSGEIDFAAKCCGKSFIHILPEPYDELCISGNEKRNWVHYVRETEDRTLANVVKKLYVANVDGLPRMVLELKRPVQADEELLLFKEIPKVRPSKSDHGPAAASPPPEIEKRVTRGRP